MGHFRALFFCTALSLTPFACTPPEPAHWAQGGAALKLQTATWLRPELPNVQISQSGQVSIDGDAQFTLDAQGRLTDPNGNPLALLATDGQLFSAENVYWGRVGLRNASPPWSSVAWTHIEADGSVLWFDDAGAAHPAGRWSGCDGAGLRVCALVTQMVLLAATRFEPSPYYYPSPLYPYPPYPLQPSVGVGIGVGF